MKVEINIDETKLAEPITIEQVKEQLINAISDLSNHYKWLEPFWDGVFGEDYSSLSIKKVAEITNSIKDAVSYKIDTK